MLDDRLAAYRTLVATTMNWRAAARALAEIPAAVLPRRKRWRDLISPHVRDDLITLLHAIRNRSAVRDADGLGRAIAPADPDIARAASTFRESLTGALNKTGAPKPPEFDLAQAPKVRIAHLVEAIIAARNQRSLERDIDTLAPPKGFARLGMEQRRHRVMAMADRLAPRYAVPRERIVRMIELRHDTQTERVTLRAILDLYKKTWSTFNVGEDRRGLWKLTAVILVNRVMHNASPLLWTQIFDGKSFNAQYMLVLGGLDIVDAHSAKYETQLSTSLLFEIRQRIHALAAQALFVRDLGLADQYGSGELFDIIWKGEDAYNNIVRSLLFDGVPTLLTIPIVLGGLTVLHPLLGALGLISIPAVYVLARTTGPKMQLAREEGLEKKRAVFTRGNTMIEGIETLLGQSHLAGGRKSFLSMLREVDTIDRDMIRRWASIHLWQRYPVAITSIVTALFGAYLVGKGAISPGGVITTADYAGRLRGTVVDMIHRYFEQFPRDINDARGLQRLLDWSAKAGGDAATKTRVSSLASTRIATNGLSFRGIVKNLNIAAEPGEFVTISGTSGIGKTTLLRLIGGLLTPSDGTVTIGGAPLKSIAAEGPDSLYTLLAISSQSPFIFDDMTLRQNLILFDPDAPPDARINEVLDSVGLAKLIPDLDKADRRRLSGGERVRFGLARALLKLRPDTPMIVLLDEPTSALADDDGPGSMGAIRALLMQVHTTHPRSTFICVTHDKQLIRQADRDISLSPQQVSDAPVPARAPLTELDFVHVPGTVLDFNPR